MVILASVLVAIVLVEVSCAFFGSQWFLRKRLEVISRVREFNAASGDDARQKAILRSGKATLQFTFIVLAVLWLLGTVAFFPAWLMNWNDALQLDYVVEVSIVATVYWLFRWCKSREDRRSASPEADGNGYGVLDRWVHWLALEPAAVRHLAFDLERRIALPQMGRRPEYYGRGPADGAVYVCGLARSGTTMLLRILDELEDFRSLTYRDMPFVLAPNLWRKITSREHHASVFSERAHRDGILVNVDSPEGLEEVFWRTFGKRLPVPDCFGFEEPTLDVLQTFAEYRAIVANPRTVNDYRIGRQRRYLSKNNNNLLRLGSLCADPTATVLLVYRNPFATARSLHRQHQRFCDAQSSDRFTRSYMGWLSHYEFGLDHLPFCFAVSEMSGKYTPVDLNYWLEYWDAIYRHVLANGALGYHLVNHDNMRAEPVKMLTSIFKTLDVGADVQMLAKQIAAPDIVGRDGFCSDLAGRAELTYRALLESSKNIR